VDTDALWHVTLTVAGDPQPVDDVRAALERLSAERPFLLSGRYDATHAELHYWEQAPDCDDACAMALRLWADHRSSASLPAWTVLGLEVMHRSQHGQREGTVLRPAGGWRRF
jgi:hypothetical protein